MLLPVGGAVEAIAMAPPTEVEGQAERLSLIRRGEGLLRRLTTAHAHAQLAAGQEEEIMVGLRVVDRELPGARAASSRGAAAAPRRGAAGGRTAGAGRGAAAAAAATPAADAASPGASLGGVVDHLEEGGRQRRGL